MRFAVSIAVAAAAIASTAHATSSVRTAGCAWGAVAWKHGCLVDGHACSARYTVAYRRQGFACRAGFLAYDWSNLRRRPLTIPRIDPGSACPLSARTGDLRRVGLGCYAYQIDGVGFSRTIVFRAVAA